MGMGNTNTNTVLSVDNPKRNRDDTVPTQFNLVDNSGNNLVDNAGDQLISDVG